MRKYSFVLLLLLSLLLLAACGEGEVTVAKTTEITEQTTLDTVQITVQTTAQTVEVPEVQDDIVLTVPIDGLQSKMEHLLENESYPEGDYTIAVTGMTVPVSLTMNLGNVTSAEIHGHKIWLQTPLAIYGNCYFDLFEADGSVILEGGYYGIGDIYVFSPGGVCESHMGEEASYYLELEENGELTYTLLHNEVASTSQTGGLSTATGYDDFYSAEGRAHIENGTLIFEKPEKTLTMSERFDLDKEFKDIYSQYFNSIDEVFEINKETFSGNGDADETEVPHSVENYYGGAVLYTSDFDGDSVCETVRISVLGHGTQCYVEEIAVHCGSYKKIAVEDAFDFTDGSISSTADADSFTLAYNGVTHTFEKSRLDTAAENLHEILLSGDITDYTVKNGTLFARVSLASGFSEVCGEWCLEYGYKDGKLSVSHVLLYDYITGAVVDFGQV